MDLLTHLFLPGLVVYALRRELFDSPLALGLLPFGLLPDADKFLGVPGLGHSLLTLVPVCGGILAVEYALRGRLDVAPVAVALAGSHLLLDAVDGGPVPLLFPLVERGIGFTYPARTVFGVGPFDAFLTVEGPLVALRTVAPQPGHGAYGFLAGAGIAAALAFWTVYVADRVRG